MTTKRFLNKLADTMFLDDISVKDCAILGGASGTITATIAYVVDPSIAEQAINLYGRQIGAVVYYSTPIVGFSLLVAGVASVTKTVGHYVKRALNKK